MSVSEVEMLRLLAEYKADIHSTISLFKQRFGAHNPVHAWCQGHMSRVGFLDEENTIEYAMHGAGCTIEFDGGKLLSFDLDETSNPYFDPWKFKLYTESVGVNYDLILDALLRSLEQKVNLSV